MNTLLGSLRVAAFTLAVCCVGYPAVFLAIGQLFFPQRANGQLLRTAEGTIVGSRQIAQGFSSDRYFWPRPSAVDFNGGGAGGSNLAPTNPALADRASDLVSRYGATPKKLLPAELATASGSGLDPHITVEAALYQVDRVARARGLSPEGVEQVIQRVAFPTGGRFDELEIVNVLELNMALDSSANPAGDSAPVSSPATGSGSP